MKPAVFIDGRVGTTGLELDQHLSKRYDLEMLSIPETARKDPHKKSAIYRQADLVILCLPDNAAREAVSLTEQTRFLDASTSHRVHQDWVYGLPELEEGQRKKIASARLVSNPGCYPTGFLLAIRPLIENKVIHPSTTIHVFAVSGYSGGGKTLIARYEDNDSESRDENLDTRPYSLSLAHKHVPEMTCYGKLEVEPIFLPNVGPFYRGMLVQITFSQSELQTAVSTSDLLNLFRKRYADEPFVRVMSADDKHTLDSGYLSARACNFTNRIDIIIGGNEAQFSLIARLDNLGKGAATAAVQNLNLMLGLDERKGLVVD